jgi:cyclic-di-AMP phosphodiesterase PgpH
MKPIIYWLQRNLSNINKTILVLISIFLLVQLFPRQPGFDYEYQQARPWLYDDLIAPFSFAILKSHNQLADERKAIEESFTPFFSLTPGVGNIILDDFESSFEAAWEEKYGESNDRALKQRSKDLGLRILSDLYNTGIIFLEEELRNESNDFRIMLLEDNIARSKTLDHFFTIQDAFIFAITELDEASVEVDVQLLQSLLESSLRHNVFYNEELTARTLRAELDEIPVTRGMVQQGEKIVSKGELITPSTFQILESFKLEYQRQVGNSAMQPILYLGQFLLVSISMIVLLLFLNFFRKDVYADNRRLLLILMSVLLMVFLTSIMIRNNFDYLYLVPVCIVPVIIRAFFDNRLALYIHIITIILIGFLIPRSFEFVFLQFLAGIIAILSMADLRRRSQLFYTVALIFATYSAVYFGLSLAHTGSFDNLYWRDFAYFAGGAFLTLFAYPLIFLFERIFGLPTDFSLLELSDTNNTLLRKLGMEAPGTFQHSLQVANLSEEAIIAIGGNSLLTRTGALYHDIGKMKNPLYFIENQSSGYNPHDEVSFRESARIIIDHVIDGIEMARKHNLPEYVIDFIRTHHGTTTARYFYMMEMNENPDEEVEKSDFIYAGPRPFSKETAVVMMADSVEAASRSLRKPDEKTISQLVNNIIDTQVNEKQFDNADITFKDITKVKSILKRMLLNIYHVRVAYPTAL